MSKNTEQTAVAADQATNEFNQVVKGVSLTRDAWRRLKKNKMAMAGLVIVIFYTLMAVSAPILPIYSYREQVIEHQDFPPSFKTAAQIMLDMKRKELLEASGHTVPDAAEAAELAAYKAELDSQKRVVNGKMQYVNERRYLMGTDNLGRDMLARIIYGSQVSIAIGLMGALFSMFIGVVIGALSGYVGGTADFLIMRVVDIIYGLPYMILVIILMAIFGNNISNLFIALSMVSWLTAARVVRGQVLSLKNSEFVEAARSMGAHRRRIMFRHLVPNTFGVIIVFATLRVPTFIMLEAFLSFLGLGVSAPYASWGSLIQDGVGGMNLYPWRLFFPSLAMALFLLAMNFLGDGLRDAFDPQSKNRL